MISATGNSRAPFDLPIHSEVVVGGDIEPLKAAYVDHEARRRGSLHHARRQLLDPHDGLKATEAIAKDPPPELEA